MSCCSRVPVLGNVFRTLALARFCWSMEMMTDSAVNIFNALQWSMEATANSAFEARTPEIIQQIKDGLPLSKSLEMSGLFPHDCIEMISVAEESGSLPETFKRLAQNYFEAADMATRAPSRRSPGSSGRPSPHSSSITSSSSR